MLETILRTKLFIPPLRPNLVPRPRLIERLNQGLQLGRKLTLVSAPAGFGKTTLVSEWIAGCEQIPACAGTAWLSLDEGDNDPTRFLAYLIAALQTLVLPEGAPQSEVDGTIPEPAERMAANFGEGVLALLQSPQPAPIESILTALLNEISTIADNFILVLDDYHLIDAQPVDKALTFVLEHLPPQMHLVIATREDPTLPLARLRVRDQMSELRANELRFTNSEAAGFLNQVMGLNLSAEAIGSLGHRTEGWIAGLQLAAISMQGRQDSTRFIKSFTGSHHFVLDYLVEEVLQRQPEHMRNFLLLTSILDRLSGSLCDAVTGQEDGRAVLEGLERGNLFVVLLDDQRHWYRYHHLFADVLQAHLMEEQPNQVPTLHLRASAWYEQNGSLSAAVRHALIAKDFKRAADLIEPAWPAMDESMQSSTWLGWVQAVPDELVRARPVLSVGYAWALLHDGQLEAAEARLRDAERWLEMTAGMSERPRTVPAEMVVVDEEQFRSLPASIATARAYHAQAIGDGPATVKYTQQVLDLLPEEAHLRRGQATTLLGLAQWASGDLEAAHRSFANFMANMRLAGDIPEVIGGTFVLADIKMALGRLREAFSIYQQALQLAAGQGEPMPPGTEDLYRGISELFRERGDLEAAAQHLLISKKLGEQAELPDWQHRLCVTEARIKEAQGDLDGALNLLDEAEHLIIRTPLPDVRPIGALKARIWIAQDRLAEALDWARERDLSVDDEVSYLREFEHVTLARVFIACYKRDRLNGFIHEVVGQLERLLKAAEEGGRMGSAIEILMLQALVYQAQGDIPRALDPLERALMLAEPEGYVRIFVDEGLPMVALLREAAKQGVAPNYVTQLRAAPSALLKTSFGKDVRGRAVTQLTIDPLSERELEVLRLLGSEMNGPEIARDLMVSLNTMRTHTKNIYSKLGVNNRRTAVRRAKELDLL